MLYQFTPKEIERFWKRVDQSGGPDACWEWQGSRFVNGYGRMCLQRGQFLTHRVAYILTNGPLPDDILVCHDCPNGDNRACCNPAHLWPGTVADNNADRVKKGREGRHVSLGERNGLSKLTADQVRAIRREYANGGITLAEVGQQYGVYPTTIHQIIRRKTWRHIE